MTGIRDREQPTSTIVRIEKENGDEKRAPLFQNGEVTRDRLSMIRKLCRRRATAHFRH